jgi:hypothetical protein
MFWGKKSFSAADYAPYQDKLAKMMMDNAPMYAQFIMVSTKEKDPLLSMCYVGVPSKAFFIGFDGFEPVAEADLPKLIDTLLVADASREEFASRFKFR